MSQDAHTPYLEMRILKRRYLKYKNSGRGGIREDIYEQMLMKYKYGFLKKRLEYLLIKKQDDIEERLYTGGSWGITDEQERFIKYKLNNDTELIQLKRLVKILKMQLLNQGCNKVYL